MAKGNSKGNGKHPPVLVPAAPTGMPPRLEGDDLFNWAQMMAEVQRVVQAKQMMAVQFLQQRGLTPGEYLLSDDGYILGQEEAQRISRVRSLPAQAPRDSQPDQGAAPQTPDSETSESRPHTPALAGS